jgi:hypothetical protein
MSKNEKIIAATRATRHKKNVNGSPLSFFGKIDSTIIIKSEAADIITIGRELTKSM